MSLGKLYDGNLIEKKTFTEKKCNVCSGNLAKDNSPQLLFSLLFFPIAVQMNTYVQSLKYETDNIGVFWEFL